MRTPGGRVDGDHFVVNGQKVWTSGAHDADVLLTFVRTDPNAPKHKGISVLLIPTDTPGVDRRPFASIYDRDDLDFNEVFFNDVRVPAENLVGPLNGGWRVANGSLGHERTMLWMSFADRLRRSRRRLPSGDRAATGTATPRWSWTIRRCGCSGRPRWRAPPAARRMCAALSVLKVLGSEAEQTRLRTRAGRRRTRRPRRTRRSTAPYNPYRIDQYSAGWFERYAGSFAGTIAGGTSEIQRNIIAQRVLGLPRG